MYTVMCVHELSKERELCEQKEQTCSKFHMVQVLYCFENTLKKLCM